MVEFDLPSIPTLVNDAIFSGNNLLAAQLLLAVFMVFVAILPMIIAKTRSDIIFVVIALMVFAMTAIGWVEDYVAYIVLALLALPLAKYLGRMVTG